ncbi:hypothetical protein DICSQDRAFT_127089 [Dichomitus squalens LYAD-421 SS1]|uniref:Uncharacterized protein n=1 Tax=Dichomitus squalens (strain LYAD-421) TaxID=732165 RepID=R7SYX8_DICSQ|nr:uncharacterized protein DICSQDRAFT_127089 [Dichomitus squalens LYAD-421 SS1]EJF61399.1 hypothetical protein DICSQDRAFT_127089 [Dichomitus squalens LYAD-421 SS1]
MVTPGPKAAAPATPKYFQLVIFVIFVFGVFVFLACTAAILGYREKLRSGGSVALADSPIATHVSACDLEKCIDVAAPSREKARTRRGRSGWLPAWFSSGSSDAGDDGDSDSVLALLPGRRDRVSVWGKVLNLLTKRNRRVLLQPDPPTIRKISRVLDAVETRERAAATTSRADGIAESFDNPPVPPPKPSCTFAPPLRKLQIPEIVVECCDPDPERAFFSDSPDNSFATTASTSYSRTSTPSLSLCAFTAGSSSSSSLVLSPTQASPAEFYFPSFPRTSISSLDLLSVPPPSSCGGSAEQAAASATRVSKTSGARRGLALAPPPRGSAGRAPAPTSSSSLSSYVTSTPAKGGRKMRSRGTTRPEVDVHAKPDLAIAVEVSSAGIAGKRKAVAVPGRPGNVDDGGTKEHGRNKSKSKIEDKRHPSDKRPRFTSASSAPILPIRLPVSSSTTSSLMDLILDAIAADTDESFHYTSVESSGLSSSSSASLTSAHSFLGDIRPITKMAPYGSFLLLEDGDCESEEDLLDAILSAYIRTDDNLKRESDDGTFTSEDPESAGSDYSDFDEISLHNIPECDPARDREDVKVVDVRFGGTFGEAIRYRVLHGLAI